MSPVLPAGDPGVLEQAVSVLRRGGVIAFPTDTVYGLGCLAGDPLAIVRLFEIKGRGRERAIPVLLAESSELPRVAQSIPGAASRLAEQFWPGPLTLVVPRRPELPAELGPEPTVGVRVPNHELARRLLRLAGPMAVTSANLSGGADSLTADDVSRAFSGGPELVLDGGPAPGGVPSTVVDCVSVPPRLIRRGPVGVEALRRHVPDLIGQEV